MENQENSFFATLRSLLPVLFSELALAALMVGVYAILDKLTPAVIWGAVLGTGLAIVNFAALVYSLLRAEGKESPSKGQLASTGSYVFRMIILAVALVLTLNTGIFDPVATLLPLALFRIAIMSSEVFRKKGANHL